MRRHLTSFAAVLVSLAGIAAIAAPALGGGAQGDMEIARTVVFLGDNIINTTGDLQTVKQRRTPVRATRYFAIQLENDGISDAQLSVDGCGSSQRFKVSYRDAAGNDVTAAVVAGTHETPHLVEDARTFFELAIKPRANARPGSDFTCPVSVTSPGVTDVAKGVVEVRG
jgi:hypothetical protein